MIICNSIFHVSSLVWFSSGGKEAGRDLEADTTKKNAKNNNIF